MIFAAKFNYSKEYPGQVWWPMVKNLAEETLVKAWNEHCNYSNPRLESWNEEFAALHPESDGWSEEYTDFMRGKYAPVVAQLNENGKKSKIPFINFTYRTGDELELVETCKFKNSELFDVYFTLVEA